MKSTQVTELFANIKNTFVSFFSILMFVALGVGIFLGISWSGPALQNAADEVFNKGSFYSFQIQYYYGLTDDDLKALSSVEGVTDVEPTNQSFQTIVIGSEKRTVKVQTLTERINTPIVLEGELPTKANEVAMHAVSAKELGIKVGDTVTFQHDADPAGTVSLTAESGSTEDPDGMKYLTSDSFTVTALVNNAEYLADDSATYGYSNTPSGLVDAIIWVPSSAFDSSAFLNGYPVVNVQCTSLQGIGTFSDTYKAQSFEIEKRISELGDKLADKRYDDLHGQAQQKVDDAEKQLTEGKQKIASGEQELANARARLVRERAIGRAQLSDAYAQLTAAQAEYDARLAKFNEMKGAYDHVVSQIEGTKAQIASLVARKAQLDAELASGAISQEEYDKAFSELVDEANAMLDPCRQFISDLPEIKKENFDMLMILALSLLEDYRDIPITINGETMTLNEAEQRLAEGKAALDQGNAALQAKWSEYYAARDEFNNLVAEGQAKIADGERQLEDAKRQVAENEPKLEDAKAQLAGMKDYDWTVTGRNYNAGAAEISVFSGVTGNLSFSMAALFIIVGLLVSYSAVSRIVHEQITQIGTKKALGLRAGEITTSFLAYSAIAVACGSIIGTLVGILLVEGIIGHVLGGMFIMGDYPPYFGLLLFLIVTAIELALVLGATWFACRSILRKHAVELLKGEEPPKAKTRFYEKWGIWSKLPLFTQTLVNNCVNDKRRVFSTVVGVAGCTALIVTAITLNNDVLASYDRHYSDVYNFNALTYVDSSVDGANDKVEKTLQNQGSLTAQAVRKSFVLTQPDGDRGTIRIIVPKDNEAFSQIYHVNPRSGGTYDASQEGAWVSQAYAEHFGAKEGDMLRVDAGDGTVHNIPILGFYEFWLTYNEVVMNSTYYEKEFSTTLAPNLVLANTGNASVAEVAPSLTGIDGFDSISDDKIYQHRNFESFASVSSAVVFIYIALSVLMAIVVLLNLNVMFIDEKKRELIVLMINGFSVKDAKRYIYNDTIVLTAIGIICGIVLGCIMGSITVGSIEPETASFVKSVDWIAVVAGVIGSSILAFIMTVIALRRIPRFELTDINKF